MIPTKISVKGDIAVGKGYIGFAKSQLDILKRQMSYQSLNEGYRVVEPLPGIVVECFSKISFIGNREFSYDEVVVHSHGGRKKPEYIEEEKVIEELECYCFPHITLGKILAVYPSILPVPAVGDYATTAEYHHAVELYERSIEEYNTILISHECFTYDVEVCAVESYTQYLGVHDPNYGRYYVDQTVLVGVGYVIEGEFDRWETFPATISYPCDRSCMVTDPHFPNIIVMPLHIVDEYGEALMDKWFKEEERVVRNKTELYT